jgi:type IV secretory pathway ATPase VirB11/archaellum biosynthesis ATPase
MNTNGESPPPTFSRLDEVLADFKHTSQASDIQKPAKRVRVKKKGQALEGLRKLLASKKKEKEPNCASAKNVIVSGDSNKTLSLNCEGCKFSSDLNDPECRMRCAQLVGKQPCNALVLDDGFYKREYGKRDADKLRESYTTSESLAICFPDECGLCAGEHKQQVDAVKKAMLRDPVKLLRGGVDVEENLAMTVSGVERAICSECRRRTEEIVGKTLLRLQETHFAKHGYDFAPLVRPFFSNSRVLFEIPEKNRIETSYENNGAKVVLSKGSEEVYSLFPSEYRFGKKELEVMKLAYSSVVKGAGSLDDRQFESACKSALVSAASKKGYQFSEEDTRLMTDDLVRCTLGLDVIELLLKDQNLQDVYINSPIDTTPLYVKHKDFDDCRTNVYTSEQAARNIISKFRLRSGRAFSEVSPILDMELPEFGVRVNITGPPISPDGLAFAFRRASEEPWTLLRFIENRMISPLAAGLLGVMVNEESAVLMCGDRGSGKTSMLTALVGAMPIKYRILTMEDTFEIPVPALAEEGFRIQRMRIKPPTAADSFELGANEAMRSLLRMGDSAIVMGEVRGEEAKTLYEAMNVGGSGNCVLGTIHGKSPRSLLERVVFSLGVPPQSFKATDLVVIADRIRPGGGSKKLRRVTEIVEVGKGWKEPEAERVFSTLMSYDQEKDMLVAGERLRKPEKSEVICKIARRRGMKPKNILEDINARADVYGYALELAGKMGDRKLLGLRSMVGLNQEYARLVDESLRDSKKADYDLVAEGVKKWLTRGQRSVRIGTKNEDGLRETVQIAGKGIQC